ncbi:hypothetical protein QTI59_07490 [Clostridium perfringens]|nr:hypothetical protein [Clostridium perfringens]
MNNLLKKYNIKEYNITEKNNDIYIGEKQEQRCKFCGLAKGEKIYINNKEVEVKFKKVAHAIPHLLGNNKVFSNEECDICNQYFSGLENDLGNFLIPFRSIFNLKGKRGNKYKANQIEITNNNDCIFINEIKRKDNNENAFKIDFTNNTATLKLQNYKYIPSNVYRTFIKIALSLSPVDICKRLNLYRDYLMDINMKSIPNMFISVFYIPGMNKDKKLIVRHMIRKDSDVRYPLVILSVRISSLQFTISLYEKNYYPMVKKMIVEIPEIDEYQKENMLFPENLGTISFHSNDKVSSNFEIPFSYGEIEILDLKNENYEKIKNMSIDEILKLAKKRKS